MTPFVAEPVTHRTRMLWLAAALAASVAAFNAAPSPRALKMGGGEGHWMRPGMGRCVGHAPPTNRLPAECVAYQDRLWRLSECDQLPREGRRALRDAWDKTTASWLRLPADARAHLAEGCRMGSAALDEAAEAISCTFRDRDRILIAGPVGHAD